MADTGEPFAGYTPGGAVEVARSFWSGDERRDSEGRDALYSGPEWRGVIRRPDQWTLQARALLPMHRVAMNDERRSVVYVSDRTGRVELVTDASSRFWGWVGAVPHWLYFRVLRTHSGVWYQVVVWLSVAGLAVALSGLVWGLVVWVRKRRIAYSGWLYWHQLGGLVFGVVTAAWLFSGLLSMEPWNWSSSTSPSRAEREVMTGGAFDLSELTVEHLRESLRLLEAELPGTETGEAREQMEIREIELLQFSRRLLLVLHDRDGERHLFRLSPTTVVDDAVLRSYEDLVVRPGALERRDLERLAFRLRPAEAPSRLDSIDWWWLSEYDSYYRDRAGRLPLPVLRISFDDRDRTTFYLDALTGQVVRKETRRSRLNRWLYRGLHSWDFPFLYERRPLWDIVVIGLSIGGLLAAASAAVPGWRRLKKRLPRRA